MDRKHYNALHAAGQSLVHSSRPDSDSASASHQTTYTSTKQFEMVRVVGQGSFGIVRQCRSLLDGSMCAVKSIPLNTDRSSFREGDQARQMQEVEIMRGLNHPFIIEYRGYFTDLDFGHAPKEKVARAETIEEPDDTYRGEGPSLRERLAQEQQSKK